MCLCVCVDMCAHINKYITTTMKFHIIARHSRWVNLLRCSSSVKVSYLVSASNASAFSSGDAWSGQVGCSETTHISFMYTHTHIHTHIYIYMCVCKHNQSLQLCIHIQTHLCTHTYIHIHTHTHIYICVCASLIARKTWVPPNSDPRRQRSRCHVRSHWILAMCEMGPRDPHTAHAFLHCSEALYFIRFRNPTAWFPRLDWLGLVLTKSAFLGRAPLEWATMVAVYAQWGTGSKKQLWLEGTL